MLEKANQMFNLNPRLGDSLREISEKIQDQQQLSEQPPSTAAQPAAAELPKALRGLNPKLLEKIRQESIHPPLYGEFNITVNL